MFKQGLKILLVLTVMISLIPIAFAAEPIDWAVVSNPNPADRLNLRKSASSTSESLGRYYNGTHVSILAYSGDFAQVLIGRDNGDIMGYMQTKYLDTSASKAQVQAVFPSYSHSGKLTVYDSQTLQTVRATFNSPTVWVMGFTDTAWHVLVDDTTGFIKPGDKRLIDRPAGNQAEDLQTAVVNNPNPADRLNLRKEASAASDSLCRYYNGTRVAIVENVNAEWAKVKIGSLTGYMQRKFLAVGAAANKVSNAMPDYLSLSSAWEAYESTSLKGHYTMYGYLQTFKVMGFSDRFWHILIGTDNMYFVSANGFSPYHLAAVNNPNPFDRLHIRQKGSKESLSYGKFYNGFPLYVLEENPASKTWVKVVSAREEFEISGYVEQKYLALDEAAQKVTPVYPLKELSGKNGASVRLRGFFFEKDAGDLGTYPSGTKAWLIGVSDDYVFVEVNGILGIVGPDEIK